MAPRLGPRLLNIPPLSGSRHWLLSREPSVCMAGIQPLLCHCPPFWYVRGVMGAGTSSTLPFSVCARDVVNIYSGLSLYRPNQADLSLGLAFSESCPLDHQGALAWPSLVGETLTKGSIGQYGLQSGVLQSTQHHLWCALVKSCSTSTSQCHPENLPRLGRRDESGAGGRTARRRRGREPAGSPSVQAGYEGHS